ncbi:hypothetical protein ZIOFF_013850 [Zingiber officinale]|uniref:Uncharacterized protein n=1 Tax=Zingiber officinale TaxID=94328 RepID=A0A8J5HGK3_ZINOF|nr:hypothetical protein ZIOFF_013850 [Zingiber officinale]
MWTMTCNFTATPTQDLRQELPPDSDVFNHTLPRRSWAVDSGGNVAKAGLRARDQVLYTSSFFGDELWPADKLGFIKIAIQAKPDSLYFVVNRGAEVDVKRLTKRPAPARFGRTLTEAQKAS